MENLNVTLVESSSLHKDPNVVMCTRTLSALIFQNWLAKIEGDSLDVCVCVYPMRRILYTLQFHPQLAKTILPTLNYKYRWWWDEKYICFISILALLLFKGVLWRGVGCTVGVVQWSTWPCSADRQNLQTATGQLKIGILGPRVLKTLR